MLDIDGENKNKRRVEVLLSDIPFELFFSSIHGAGFSYAEMR
jgi:hypothetical protein